MKELPDIELDTSSERSSPKMESLGYRNPGYARAFLMAFVTFLVSALIAMGITLVGRESILGLFGMAPSEKPDPYEQRMVMIEAEMTSLKSELNTLRTDMRTQSENAGTQAFEQGKLENRLTVVERFTSDLEQKIKKHQAAQAELVVKKKVVSAKPKPAPVIPPILMSIRNISGVAYVALREGLDASELLMPGDTWKGWTFVDADPVRKVARFRYQDKIQELWL